MKRIAALLLMGAAALSLTACGGGSSNKATSTSTASGSSEATSASSSQKTSGSSVAGETYDTGSFTVLVPDGWMVVEQLDMSQEADEDGNYPVDKESIGLIKGGESEWDAFSKPTIYLASG